jgi:hypothetical protein
MLMILMMLMMKMMMVITMESYQNRYKLVFCIFMEKKISPAGIYHAQRKSKNTRITIIVNITIINIINIINNINIVNIIAQLSSITYGFSKFIFLANQVLLLAPNDSPNQYRKSRASLCNVVDVVEDDVDDICDSI